MNQNFACYWDWVAKFATFQVGAALAVKHPFEWDFAQLSQLEVVANLADEGTCSGICLHYRFLVVPAEKFPVILVNILLENRPWGLW